MNESINEWVQGEIEERTDMTAPDEVAGMPEQTKQAVKLSDQQARFKRLHRGSLGG